MVTKMVGVRFLGRKARWLQAFLQDCEQAALSVTAQDIAVATRLAARGQHHLVRQLFSILAAWLAFLLVLSYGAAAFVSLRRMHALLAAAGSSVAGVALVVQTWRIAAFRRIRKSVDAVLTPVRDLGPQAAQDLRQYNAAAAEAAMLCARVQSRGEPLRAFHLAEMRRCAVPAEARESEAVA